MKPTPAPLPPHIVPYAFTFRWDNEKVWALSVPTESMDVSELVWHLDIKWLHTPEGRFDLTPIEIMSNPTIHSEQYDRTMNSDLSFPIDVMIHDDHWQILDGLHRLMKSIDQGLTSVTVRKISPEMIPLIVKD